MNRRTIMSLALGAAGLPFAARGAHARDCPAPTDGLEFEVYTDGIGEWRWRLWSKNGNKIATSHEGYRNRSACLRGVAIVKSSFAAPIIQTP